MPELEKTILDTVVTPEDLRRLSPEKLERLSDELREFIIRELSANPGHLGSSLGVVELSVALHYVFDTPKDRIVWDVGHQAYAHKILTGRRERFHTNRKLGGISGFPSPKESPYDAFGAGHSSTSVSAALGLETAARLLGDKRHTIAVIGDGALTGGLAFEGLNNAGGTDNNLLVILNDNRMSIARNAGAMKEYLLTITTSWRYNRLKRYVWKILSKTPGIRRFIQKMSYGVKAGLLQQGNLFESFNFRYFGPVNGHDVKALTKVLNDLKQIEGPKLLHILTQKGKGYKPAQDNPAVWHAPGRFNPETGEIDGEDSALPPKFQDIFGLTLLELAEQNAKIAGVTPAMPTGCSLNYMMDKMPERTFDVGIAEGHAVTFSAGLAAGGMVPFCNIYSSFMQRAYDNVVHDVALQKLNVVLCLDRAGLVGEDGATHHGVFDIAAFRNIPDLIISSPLDGPDLRNLMYTAQTGNKGAFMIRYPRGRSRTPDWRKPMEEVPVGKSRRLRSGKDVALLTYGPVGIDGIAAAERAAQAGVSVEHIDLRFVKPLDEETLHRIGGNFRTVVTVEDGVIAGGAGSAVLEFFHRHGYEPVVKMLGVPDRFVQHGSVDELRRLCGYDEEGIFRALTEPLHTPAHGPETGPSTGKIPGIIIGR